MVTLEQVKLLDTRVTKTVEYIKKLTGENALLQGKLDSYQRRIDELELLINRFREEQSRIEDGILSALDRLNQFEDAVESMLTQKTPDPVQAVPASKNPPAAPIPVDPEPEEPVDPEPEEAVLLDPLEPSEQQDRQSQENELDIF